MNTSPSTPPRPPRDKGRRPRQTTTTTGMSPQKSKQKNHHDNNNGVENITRGLQAVTSPSKASHIAMSNNNDKNEVDEDVRAELMSDIEGLKKRKGDWAKLLGLNEPSVSVTL